MSQAQKAEKFSALHQKGNPVVLYNIWDAGTAKAVAKAGANAVATGSWSVAAAQGFADGEEIPLALLLTIVERICATVEVPVTVDFEGGYAAGGSDLAENVRKVIRAGAVGINFEDRIVQGEGLYPMSEQADRIRTIKTMARQEGVPIFMNARTDLFLSTDPSTHGDLLMEAKEREVAYRDAGADCFFIPGLTEPTLVASIVEASGLPVNVMMMGGLKSVQQAAELGASRVSFGPAPYRWALKDLQDRYQNI